jgi:hypothetical protein
MYRAYEPEPEPASPNVAELTAAVDTLINALVVERRLYAEALPHQAVAYHLVSFHTFLLRMALLRRDGDREALVAIADALLRSGEPPRPVGVVVH